MHRTAVSKAAVGYQLKTSLLNAVDLNPFLALDDVYRHCLRLLYLPRPQFHLLARLLS
jgi:hypothetical protein